MATAFASVLGLALAVGVISYLPSGPPGRGNLAGAGTSAPAGIAHAIAWNCSVSKADASLAGATLPGRATAAAPAAAQPASDLRVALSRLLAEHAFLTMETMRATALKAPDEGALRAGLDANTAELQSAIAGVYGADAGTAFAGLWKKHIDALVSYARAKAGGDNAGSDTALTALELFRRDFAEFLAKANPKLSATTEEQALQLHIQQLTAITESNYAAAYAAEREAFHHMFEMGDMLALAIGRQFPDRYPDAKVAFSPSADLRLTLDRLLGEHLILAAEAMRAGLAKAPDFDAARAALDANTADLANGIAAYYGAPAGDEFRSLWQDHVTAYMEFIGAVANKDATARAESLGRLHAYHDQIAAFLSDANPFLNAEDVAALIRRHVQALITQVESAEAGDHARTVATVRGAYAQTFEVGDALASAIARQFPDRFRDITGLPPTSIVSEPAAAADAPSPGILVFLLVTVVLAALSVGGRARSVRPAFTAEVDTGSGVQDARRR